MSGGRDIQKDNEYEKKTNEMRRSSLQTGNKVQSLLVGPRQSYRRKKIRFEQTREYWQPQSLRFLGRRSVARHPRVRLWGGGPGPSAAEGIGRHRHLCQVGWQVRAVRTARSSPDVR